MQQNIAPKEVLVLSVETPARDLLFYERVEANKFRDGVALPAMDTAHPKSARWPNHKLCGIVEDGEEGWLRFYYMASRASQEAYNWNYLETLSQEQPEARLTFVVKRADYVPGAIAAPPSLGGRTWTYMGEEQQQTDERTRGLFVVTQHVYMDIANPLSGQRVDLETGEVFAFSRQIVAAGTAGSGVNASGQYQNVAPINRLWSMRSTEKVAGLIGAATKTRSYDVIEPYSWPAVLSHFDLLIFPGPTAGEIAKIGARPVWKEWEYNGPCRMTITESWTPTAPTLPTLTPFLERPIDFDGVLLQIHERPCLHGALWFREVNGTVTEDLGLYAFFQQYPATEPADWPATYVAAYKVTPAAGGFLTRSTLVHRPERAGRSNVLVLEVTDAGLSSVDVAWTLSNLAAGHTLTEYRLDVSTSPTFVGSFVSGFEDLDENTATSDEVTGLELNVVYYARVRAVLSTTGGPVTVTSNTAVLLVSPLAQLQVEYPGATVLADGGDIDFGNALVSGTDGPFTVTLRNTGNIDLTDLVVTKSGTHAAQFTVGALGATTVAAGGTTTFTVSFSPTSTGAKTAALSITSNDETSPFSIDLLGTGVNPLLQAEYPLSTPLTSGSSTISGFAATTAPTSDSKTVYLRSGNGETVSVSLVEIVGSPLGWNVSLAGPFTVTGVGVQNIDIGFNIDGSLTSGSHSATLRIVSDDPASPFLINLDGTVS